MPFFFKIADDGNCVYVAKTLVSNEMKQEEFDQKAVRLTVDKFLSKFPKEISEKLETNIKRVKEINDMKLSTMRFADYPNPSTRTTRNIYTVGDKKFAEDCGEEEVYHQYNEAVAYGKEVYGEKKAEEVFQRLRSEKVVCFSGTKEISVEQYKNLLKEKEKLTNMVCMQNRRKTSSKI